MSIIRCGHCEQSVDTDFVTCEVLERKYDTLELCPKCAEKYLDELEAQDAAAALAEYNAEKASAQGVQDIVDAGRGHLVKGDLL